MYFAFNGSKVTALNDLNICNTLARNRKNILYISSRLIWVADIKNSVRKDNPSLRTMAVYRSVLRVCWRDKKKRMNIPN